MVQGTDLDIIHQIEEAKDDKFEIVIIIVRRMIDLIKRLKFTSTKDAISKLNERVVQLQSFMPQNLLITNVGRRCIACIVEVFQEHGVMKPAIPLFESSQEPAALDISSDLYRDIISKLHKYEEHVCSIRLKPCDFASTQPYNTGTSIGYCSPNDLCGSLTARASRMMREVKVQDIDRDMDRDGDRDDEDRMDALDNEYKNVHRTIFQTIVHGDIVLVVSPGIQLYNYLVALHNKGVKFELVVLENEPLHDGLQAALHFASCGINTSLIADSALMIVLPKVSTVLLEPELVLNNGGAIASSGSVLAAMAAKVYNLPVYCLCETFQFCTAYPSALTALILSANPAEILPHGDSYDAFKKLTIKAPFAGYIEPEFVNYYMTCEGIFKPEAIFQLLQAIMNV